MDTSMVKGMIENAATSFSDLTESPEIFLEIQLDKAEIFKIITKQLYDSALSLNGLTDLKAKALPRLLIDGFDEEQIWQQLELQTKCAISHFAKSIAKLNPENISLSISKENEDHVQNNVDADLFPDEHSSSGDEEYVFDDDSSSSIELQKHSKQPESKKNIKYASEVDDQFFKLSKMEEFLKLEDLKEEKGDVVISDYEDEIDLYQDIPSDSISDEQQQSDDDDTKPPKKSSRDLMYEDFFDAPESGDESASDFEENRNKDDVEFEEMEENEEMKKLDSDKEKAMFNENISKNADAEGNQKTAFELEQDKIRKKIQEYEKNMLEPLPWHLTGEVAASNRPVDSLVYQETEFDSNAKQDLVVDNVLNEKIENIIRTAIINKTFTDVERKIKPNEELIAYKKEIVVDQAKSKKSLAEVYEEDYLKKKTKQEEEENPKHKEIKKLMDELFPELHALFCHIPKPAVPDIKIVSNLPAIAVEEVAPTSISDAALLAPEEVKKKSGLVKGKSERTDTDRKRERRKKKLLQKMKEIKRKEKTSGKPLSARTKKLERKETLKKLKQHRNTKIANVDEGDKIKSSKDFFSRLHETVHAKPAQIANKKQYSKPSKK